MNELKEKLKNGEKILGTLVCLTDPCLCEIMGNIGYSCVWIDTEHTYMSYKDVLCHLNAAKASGISSIIRLPQNDLTATKKILEMGPDGIIFPMAKSYDDAISLIDMTLYPPLGTRGFGPMRAIKYGMEDAKEYVEKKSLDMCRFVQIEHIDMINELEKIAEIPYIDGFIFGPNDLSGSVGEMLDIFGDKTIDSIKRAVNILKAHNKPYGFAIGMDEEILKKWNEFEPNMIFSGGDWNFIYNQAKSTFEILKELER